LDLSQIVLLYGVLLVSLVVHEAAHALFALLGGDRTAYVGGQVSLNPVPHIRREPFGTVILPLLMLFLSKGTMIFGYAHTPIDPLWAHRHPKRAALMSAAGPLSNALLAALAFLALKALVMSGAAVKEPVHELQMLAPAGSSGSATLAAIKMASTFLTLNVLLAVLNLFPLPPLDGAGVVEGLAPRQTRRLYDLLRSQPFFFLIALVAIWNVMPQVYHPILNKVYSWI
jgi:Zn-dependent protease